MPDGPTPPMFACREDAAWLLTGFGLFLASSGLVIGSVWLAGGGLRPAVLPLGLLLVFSAAILEVALRRLQAQLTGKTPSPWPAGLVSISTLTKAVMPSTMSEAAHRVGLNGKVVTWLLYAVLVADVIALVSLSA